MKRIIDWSAYESVLPYSSEMFGVYQPMIGWRSKRKAERIRSAAVAEAMRATGRLADRFAPELELTWDGDFPSLARIRPGTQQPGRTSSDFDTVLMATIATRLDPGAGPDGQDWAGLLEPGHVEADLTETVFPTYRTRLRADLDAVEERITKLPDESDAALVQRQAAERQRLVGRFTADLKRESSLAGALTLLQPDRLRGLFYPRTTAELDAELAALVQDGESAESDAALQFDPNDPEVGASVSPIGIVHLYRQYFFELDTFLGTPTEHVWLAPGSSVELIQTSTRTTLVERTIAAETETTAKSETSRTDRDELSEAVKQDNRDDTKLGVSTTVQQSWPMGSGTATASLNLDRTQQTAREATHKRMREQTDKLSEEIRKNYKTTFRTVTETTDTSSIRHVLSNQDGKELINYELRRKMRQVAIQVQDVGSYLCWETFVDDPGRELGLAELLHLAKPADLQPQPNQADVVPPPDTMTKEFQVNATWDFGDTRRWNDPALGFVELGSITMPVQPDAGYELVVPRDSIPLARVSGSGEGSGGVVSGFFARVVGSMLKFGLRVGPNGREWDERQDFALSGTLGFAVTAAKRAEVAAANAQIVADRTAANLDNERATTAAYFAAAVERVKLARSVRHRRYEDLREEERTVVYRNLIKSLMTQQHYREVAPGDEELIENGHVLAELINSIFDVDRMLYFVASEWWRPRRHSGLELGNELEGALPSGARVRWSDDVRRQDDYLITGESEPAALGSSLGWLLQLDGDDLRNAFLNAPWVKAVIPIRPGKEIAALNWLEKAGVEGVTGLGDRYLGDGPGERDAVRKGLLDRDPADPVAGHPEVTVDDAIRFLCIAVAEKHQEANAVDRYPKIPNLPEDDKVAATPTDRVFEHGFYPLRGGFRASPASLPDGADSRNFSVFDQWVEILPTDQIVPVAVRYDPLTGRQLPAAQG